MRKPILCLDFDGVIHSYSSGWQQDVGLIPDPPVPGALPFILAAMERFTVAIYSSRSASPWGIAGMQQWLVRHVALMLDEESGGERSRCDLVAADMLAPIQWPTEKPPALVTLDDRAITFTGSWPSLDELAAFQPWNKRPAADAEVDATLGLGNTLIATDAVQSMGDFSLREVLEGGFSHFGWQNPSLAADKALEILAAALRQQG